MIDVLMTALQFAPVQTIGAFRAIELVKRLPSRGIKPTVLTIDPDQADGIFAAQKNHALANAVPDEVEVVYLRSSVDPRPETQGRHTGKKRSGSLQPESFRIQDPWRRSAAQAI